MSQGQVLAISHLLGTKEITEKDYLNRKMKNEMICCYVICVMPCGGGEKKNAPTQGKWCSWCGRNGVSWVMVSRMCANRSLPGIMNLCDGLSHFLEDVSRDLPQTHSGTL